ncbi:MAG TPA: FecR family protein [bacterium]|nr:FecR family protein [bacterium]
MTVRLRTLARRCLPVLAVVLLCLLPTLASAAEVTYVVRPVEVKRKGSDKFVVLHLHDKVYAGDTIRTGFGGRVEITISEKRVFRIGQASEVELPELQDDRGKGIRARFNLLLGRFWGGVLRPLKNLQAEHFQVHTATAVIGVKGTQFGVDYEKKTDETRALVIKGTVAAQPPPKAQQAPVEIPGPREVAPPQEISRDEWLLLVSQDQKVIIRPGEIPQAEPLTAEDKADEWVRFNTERDAALAQQP